MKASNLIYAGLWAFVACGIVGCSMPQVSGQSAAVTATQISLVSACGSYTSALAGAAMAKADGRLTAAQIGRIEASETVADAVCKGSLPSGTASDLTALNNAVLAINTAESK